MSQAKEKRPTIEKNTAIAVWAAAAGRCTFCNRLVLENEDMGEVVPIGELAHNVGWGKNSPRGSGNMGVDDRADPANLLLLCRTCHKPTDSKKALERYSIEKLRELKRQHETRIRTLTAIGGDKKAVVLRLAGNIRNVPPELTYDTVLEATVASGYFPELLPRAYRSEIEIDLRDRANAGTPEYFAECAKAIDDKVAVLHEGVRLDSAWRVAVFGFARIPLLVHLGARLDDKVNTLIFQRQRTDGKNAWCWPAIEGQEPPTFTIKTLRQGNEHVALLLNLSGTIDPDAISDAVDSGATVYAVEPVAPAAPNPSLINSPQALANFEKTFRQFLADTERTHGKVKHINVFPAIPVSCAIVLGRALMPDVSPSLVVFDRNDSNNFFAALEVSR